MRGGTGQQQPSQAKHRHPLHSLTSTLPPHHPPTYRSRELPEEELKQCLYSIGDNNAYLYQARDPVDKMISYLKDLFPASDAPSEATSLAITGGKGGARLTHSHQRQYAFVLQSLTLWREIANDMFRLWYAASQASTAQQAKHHPSTHPTTFLPPLPSTHHHLFTRLPLALPFDT